MEKFQGIGVSNGIVSGTLVIQKQEISVTKEHSYTKEEELQRFLQAHKTMVEQLEQFSNEAGAKYGLVAQSIIDGHLFMTKDAEYISEIKNYIQKTSISAKEAILKATYKRVMQCLESQDVYLKSRAEDIKEVGNQLIKALNFKEVHKTKATNSKVILLTNRIGITSLLTLPDNIEGILLLEGQQQSHLTVLANIIMIPMIVRVPKSIIRWSSYPLTINGGTGEIIVQDLQFHDKTGH